MSDDFSAWVDHDYPPHQPEYEKCKKCGNDLILTHHCNNEFDLIRNAYTEYEKTLQHREHGGIAADRFIRAVAWIIAKAES